MAKQQTGSESVGGQQPAAEGQQRIEKYLADLHQDYARREQEACSAVQKDSVKAQREYNDTVQNATFQPDADSQRRIRDAYLAYVKTIDDLRLRYEQSLASAFREYLQGLQRALGEVDVASLDPSSLAALSHSAMVIAQCAGQLPKESFAAAR